MGQTLERRVNKLEQTSAATDLSGKRADEMTDLELAMIICPDNPQRVLSMTSEELAQIACRDSGRTGDFSY